MIGDKEGRAMMPFSSQICVTRRATMTILLRLYVYRALLVNLRHFLVQRAAPRLKL